MPPEPDIRRRRIFDAMRSATPSNEGKTPVETRTSYGPNGFSNVDPAIVSVNALRQQPEMPDLTGRQSDGDPRVMALPASGEVVVGKNGRIEGFGTQRDYEPLASINALKRQPDQPTEVTTPSSDTSATRPRYSGFPVGDSQLDRSQARIQAMQQADPEAEIQETGTRVGHGAKQPWGRKHGAGIGALAGVEMNQQGTLGEKLGGAIAGAITGGFKPNLSAAFQRDYQIKGEQQKEAQQLAMEQERAKTQKLLSPQVFAPSIQTDADGNLVSVQGGRATPVTDRAGNSIKKQAGEEYRSEGGVLYRIRRGQAPEPVIDTRVDYTDESGTYKVPASTAVTAHATAGARKEQKQERQDARTEKQGESQARRTAKLRESDDALANAKIYENNATEAEKIVSDPSVSDEQVTAAQAEARQYRAEAATLRRQSAAARAEAESIPVNVAPQRTQGSGGANWAPTKAFRDLFQKKNGRPPNQADIDAYAAAANQ